jgi:hypothetical protein
MESGITCTQCSVTYQAQPFTGCTSGDGIPVIMSQATYYDVPFEWSSSWGVYYFTTSIPTLTWTTKVDFEIAVSPLADGGDQVNWGSASTRPTGAGGTGSPLSSYSLSGGMIQLQGHDERSYPLGCFNGHLVVECAGVARYTLDGGPTPFSGGP